jgi:hypothetical protein
MTENGEQATDTLREVLCEDQRIQHGQNHPENAPGATHLHPVGRFRLVAGERRIDERSDEHPQEKHEKQAEDVEKRE